MKKNKQTNKYIHNRQTCTSLMWENEKKIKIKILHLTFMHV